jgi:hypothetical protein
MIRQTEIEDRESVGIVRLVRPNIYVTTATDQGVI